MPSSPKEYISPCQCPVFANPVTYITELCRLAENCDYGTFKEELIRDRLMVGILDQKILQQLQMDSTLTVEKANKTIPGPPSSDLPNQSFF